MGYRPLLQHVTTKGFWAIIHPVNNTLFQKINMRFFSLTDFYKAKSFTQGFG
jgi:hypothetical protein